MRLKSLFVLVAAVLSLGFVTPQPAAAFDSHHNLSDIFDRPDQPKGWGRMRTIRHWVYRPHYNHVYLTHPRTDPYAYKYSQRGYYPYYNSGYWGAPRVKRYSGSLPRYHAAWGSNRSSYKHVSWHRKHHGGHRRGDW